MLCVIVQLIPDPIGAKNTEALSLALSALQDLTDSTEGVSPSIITGNSHGSIRTLMGEGNATVFLLSSYTSSQYLCHKSRAGDR